MATEEVRELLVRVSATTELLKSNLLEAERSIDKFSKTADAAGLRTEKRFQAVDKSAQAQRAGMQQLSYQLGDIATMYSLGARPMQIFASQSGQVVQAIQLATGGTSRFAAFLGGPWGIALTAGIIALTPFISKLFDTADAADTAREALRKLQKAKRDSVADDVAALEVDRDSLKREIFGLEQGQGVKGMSRVAVPARLQQKRWELAETEALIRVGRQDIAERNTRTIDAGATGRVSSGRGGGGSGRAAKEPEDIWFDTLQQARIGASQLVDETLRKLAEGYDKEFEEVEERARNVLNAQFEERQAMQEKLAQIEQRQIGALATLWESAFRGGTKAIWRDFKDIGLAVISQLLARFTLARISGGGGGFDLGSALNASLFSVLGFAEGGRPPVGRVSVVGERGPELFVPDAAGTIIPNGGYGGGGVSVTINAPGATAETVAMIRREIAGAAPLLVQAAQSRTTRALTRPRL